MDVLVVDEVLFFLLDEVSAVFIKNFFELAILLLRLKLYLPLNGVLIGVDIWAKWLLVSIAMPVASHRFLLIVDLKIYGCYYCVGEGRWCTKVFAEDKLLDW